MDSNNNKLIIGKYYLLDGWILQFIGMNDKQILYQFKDKKRNNLIIARFIEFMSGIYAPILVTLYDDEYLTDDEFPDDPVY
jgi:hypothetical protein